MRLGVMGNLIPVELLQAIPCPPPRSNATLGTAHSRSYFFWQIEIHQRPYRGEEAPFLVYAKDTDMMNLALDHPDMSHPQNIGHHPRWGHCDDSRCGESRESTVSLVKTESRTMRETS